MSSTIFRHVLFVAAMVIAEVIQVREMSISSCIVCAARAILPWCALEDDHKNGLHLLQKEVLLQFKQTKVCINQSLMKMFSDFQTTDIW